MNFSYKVVIPARYASKRLPGKALLEINGKPLIQHVYESAKRSHAQQVIIATDDERIKKIADSFGASVVMTSAEHQSGTDRIAELVSKQEEPDDMIIVNVQGDEYGMPATIIDQLAKALNDNPDRPMATLCERILDQSVVTDPHVVKVVFDNANNAIYFSRSFIPWSDNAKQDFSAQSYRHIGIYAYRAGFLKIFTSLPACDLERSEKLEQLRALYHGYPIYVQEACDKSGIGIDSEADLERAREFAIT